MELTPQQISLDVLREKYCKGEESDIQDVRRRVAKALAAVEPCPEQCENIYYDAQCRGVIMAGRVNSAAGTRLSATLINCFVQPLGDSISGRDDAGQPGIYEALREAANTMRRGGGVGYDFTRLRPRGAYVNSTHSDASGPVSYMRIFDRSCETVVSAGARRGAQMGVLRIDHPDIEGFIHAKDKCGELTNFNLSVAVTDDFMEAVARDTTFDLIHSAKPGPALLESGVARKRADGSYIYRTVRARDLWDQIMRSTYDHGEPGVLFIDRINRDNNLWYAEYIRATNPCAEEPLPPYGCCCLGSINLAQLVKNPFTEAASFDEQGFRYLIPIAVRMLDNVLDATAWPLAEQQAEAMSKRRIGLGFLGLGDALIMLGLQYNSEKGRDFASQIARTLRDVAYEASIGLAKERGAFPLFDAENYVNSEFILRFPDALRLRIQNEGIRNSHLLAIAPTGTISLAFADNAANGIEPAFDWVTPRRKRRAEGGWDTFTVENHAYRVYKSLGLPMYPLPNGFVSATQISPIDHARMVTTVQPFIDAAISKTVNISRDYPFEDFKGLYAYAWREGAKSLATFRPNAVTGSILGAAVNEHSAANQVPHDLDDSDRDRRIVLDSVPTPTLNSLRWPRRPVLSDGNPARCYMVKHPNGAKFALFVGHVENGENYPFEVWVAGLEAPRGLNALAVNLSYDMYAQDRGWLSKKLDSLSKCVVPGEEFDLPMPPNGIPCRVPSLVAALAILLRHRCRELGSFDKTTSTPVLDALMSPKEPKTGPNGTMSWTVDVHNAATQDNFVVALKELVIQRGSTRERRPYSIWLSGDYPRALDGLCKSLSLDMRVIDPAWIGKKLRELLRYSEPKGDFFALVPGDKRQQVYPSTVAYIARLILHRFNMLGILDDEGNPVTPMGVIEFPSRTEPTEVTSVTARVTAGRLCRECDTYAVIKVDGCEHCTYCGARGNCG